MGPTDLLANRRVVIGGGCGFFGSYLVPAIVRTGARVTVVDNLENGELSALDPVREAVTFIEADLRDGDYYGTAVNRCARLRATASGGQVLISGVTAELVRDQCGGQSQFVTEAMWPAYLASLRRCRCGSRRRLKPVRDAVRGQLDLHLDAVVLQ